MIQEHELPRVVVPITEHRDAPLLPMLGSGFYFQRGDRIFLVSATHVIEDMPRSARSITVPRTVGSRSQLSQLGGGHLTSTSKHKEDVAIYRLDNESMISDVLSGGWRVLTDEDVETEELSHALICGWPYARLRPTDDGLKGILLAYNTKALPAPTGTQTFWPNDIFVSWPEDSEEPIPNLEGISGSPIWSQRSDGLRLAGVQHTVLRNEYIRGTHWSLVDYMITNRTTSRTPVPER